MFGQTEPQPDLDVIPHSAGCVYFTPEMWAGDEPECSQGCVQAYLDIPWAPRVRRAA